MNLSMKWLSDYVDIDVTPKQFSDDMTMSGSKVEGYADETAEIKNVVVGKLLSVEPPSQCRPSGGMQGGCGRRCSHSDLHRRQECQGR